MTKEPGGGLLSRLARPFAAIGRKAAPEAAAPAGSRGADPALVEDSFTLALQTVLDEQDGKFDTKLQVISLVEFREAVGDKWSRLAAKVLLIAEGVINLHIGAGNVFARQGEDCFVLLFRAVPHAEGRRRAVLIAQELGTRLVGDQFTGSEQPLALAAELSLAEALKPHGRLNLATLDRAVGEMRAIIAPPPSPTPPKAASAWTAVEPPARTRGRTDPDWRTMASAIAAGTARATTPPLPGDAALSLLWRPTWIANGEMIGAYRAQIQRIDQPGRPAYEGGHAYPPDDAASAMRLDRFCTGAVVREMRASQAAGIGSVAIVPLHWASASSPQRLSVLAPLADLPEEVRAVRLIIDLFGVPDSVRDPELEAAISNLRPLCREVMLRVRLAQPRAINAAECGVGVIGIDLSDLPPAEHTDDDRLLDLLARLHQNADSAWLGVYAWGIRRRAVVTGVVQGGYAMINGPGLMKDLPRLAKVLPAPRSRFGNQAGG